MQTEVGLTFAVGVEGALVEMGAHVEIVSRVVGESTGIKPGRVVVKGASPGLVELPDANADITTAGNVEGIVLWMMGREPGGDDGEFLEGETVAVLRKGRVWMLSEDAVTWGSPVYVRSTAGVGEELGRVRGADDGTDTDPIANGAAKWETSTDGVDELAQVVINLP